MDANGIVSSRHGADVPRSPGRMLAVDVGSVRVGLALTDPDRLIATPLVTVSVPPTGGPRDVVPAVAALAAAEAVTEIVVGLPLSLSGAHGTAAAGARDFAEALARSVAPVGVRLVDERFTTTSAHRELAMSGRTSRTRRPVIDQAAAVVLLQHVIDADRSAVTAGRGRGPGTAVRPEGIPA